MKKISFLLLILLSSTQLVLGQATSTTTTATTSATSTASANTITRTVDEQKVYDFFQSINNPSVKTPKEFQPLKADYANLMKAQKNFGEYLSKMHTFLSTINDRKIENKNDIKVLDKEIAGYIEKVRKDRLALDKLEANFSAKVKRTLKNKELLRIFMLDYNLFDSLELDNLSNDTKRWNSEMLLETRNFLKILSQDPLRYATVNGDLLLENPYTALEYMNYLLAMRTLFKNMVITEDKILTIFLVNEDKFKLLYGADYFDKARESKKMNKEFLDRWAKVLTEQEKKQVVSDVVDTNGELNRRLSENTSLVEDYRIVLNVEEYNYDVIVNIKDSAFSNKDALLKAYQDVANFVSAKKNIYNKSFPIVMAYNKEFGQKSNVIPMVYASTDESAKMMKIQTQSNYYSFVDADTTADIYKLALDNFGKFTTNPNPGPGVPYLKFENSMANKKYLDLRDKYNKYTAEAVAFHTATSTKPN